MAELLRQGPHHGGGLDGHGVFQSRGQDGALREEKQREGEPMEGAGSSLRVPDSPWAARCTTGGVTRTDCAPAHTHTRK